FSASVIPALHQNKTSCSESVSGIGAAKKSHHFVQSCNLECRHRANVFQPFPHGPGRIEQLELDAVVASPLLQIHEHAQTTASYGVHFRKIQHNDSGFSLRGDSLA